jgi:hypothetical protein
MFARVEKFAYLSDLCRHLFVVVYCVSVSTAAMLFSQSAGLTNDTIFTELPRETV